MSAIELRSRRDRECDGVVLLEALIIFLAFLALTLGIIDVGYIVGRRNEISLALSKAGRKAAVATVAGADQCIAAAQQNLLDLVAAGQYSSTVFDFSGSNVAVVNGVRMLQLQVVFTADCISCALWTAGTFRSLTITERASFPVENSDAC